MRFLRRYRTFGFALILILFCLLSGKFLLPKFLRAQTANGADPRIGPEFAFFDPNGQKDVYENVVQRNQFTGTIQVINSIGDTPYNPASGYTPSTGIVVLRLVGIGPSTSVAQMQAYAQKLKKNASLFPQDTIIMVGNELNNLALEWPVPGAKALPASEKKAALQKAATDYAERFNAFAAEMKDNGLFKVAPAPPDLYNSDFSGADWLTAFASSANCANIDVLVANVFEATPHPQVGGIPLKTYEYLQSNLCGGSRKVVHFGGYGANPDTSSIRQQIDFYKNHPLEGDVKSAATLIVDPCKKSNESKSDWLFYAGGNVYDVGGKLVDPDSPTCNRTEKKAPYFEYNINRDEPADKQKILGNFLDEYSVTCMPKESYIIADNSSAPGGIANCIKSLLDREGGDQCNGWGASGELKISANNKLFGLFRSEEKVKQRVDSGNDSNKRSRLESLESFFSARTTTDQDEMTQTKESTQAGKKITGDISPYQAPLYKLTNFTQQCQFIYDKLQAIRFLCDPKNRIKGDDTMCMINEEIAGTDLKALDVLQKMEMTGTPANCQTLMYPDPKSQGYEEAQELRATILKINPTLEMAYRPAFVVAVTKTNTKPNKPENRFYLTNKDETDFWAVDFLEIKVPSFGSDFLDPEAQRPGPQTPQIPLDKNEIAARSYKDPLRLTADIFTSNTNQVNFVKAENDMRNLVRAEEERLRLGTSQPRIVGADQLPFKCGTGGKYGECDELGKALVQYINAQVGLTSEATANNPLRQFNSSWKVPCQANEEDFYPNVFNDSKENRIAEKAESIGSKLETQKIGDLKKQKEILVNPKTFADWSNAEGNFSQPGMPAGTTQVFFVTPHNYTLNYSQTAFLSLLSMDQQQKLFQSGAYNAILKTGEIDEWKGSGDSFPVKNPASTTKEDPDTLKNPPGKYIGNASNTLIRDIKDGKDRMTSLLWQFGGSIANVPTRLYTLITTSPSSPLHKFTVACEKEGELATEKWFLGKCAVPKEPETKSTCEGGQVTACYNFEGACGQCDYKTNEDICLPNPKSGRGQIARISDGIIRLALKVSKETCVPAEMIVAVVAKERSGVYARNGSESNQGDLVPLNGDPNQLPIYGGNFALNPQYQITEDPYVMCKKLDNPQASISDPRLYYMDCGPMSYSQYVFDQQVKVYDPNGTIIQSCLNAIGVKDSDARRVGVNMCAAAAELWRGVYLSKNWDRSRSLNEYRGTTYGCGPSSFASNFRSGDFPSVPKQAYSLSELRSQGYDDASFADGFYSFSKNREASNVNETYFSFMKAFQAQVEKVRAEGDTCKQETN